jgi:hypothetical protein
MRYGGDIKNVAVDKQGNLVITSGIDEIHVSAPVIYYADDKAHKINAAFLVIENEIGFKLPQIMIPQEH